jgi:CheY-like chemotaxis protein
MRNGQAKSTAQASGCRGRVVHSHESRDDSPQYAQIEMDTAENGLTACEKAEKSKAEGRPYDLILMDMYMPKMNGQEAVKQLRMHGWSGPIVAVSVFDEEEQMRLFPAGCDDYIAKPITKKKLEKVLARYLKLEGVAQPLDAASSIATTDVECRIGGIPNRSGPDILHIP